MMISKNIKYSIVIMTVFIWIGFVCSISFMEAWLKFHALNVTLQIGLSIGRLIFDALNKVEWALVLIIMIPLSLSKHKMTFLYLIYLAIPVALLIIQTFWILPGLNERVEMILSGNEVSPSLLHFYYLIMELIKVACLFIFGIATFKFSQKKEAAVS